MSLAKPDYYINSEGLPNILAHNKNKKKYLIKQQQSAPKRALTKSPLPIKSARKLTRNRSIDKMPSNCESNSVVTRKNLANQAIKQNLLTNKKNKDFINSQINKSSNSNRNLMESKESSRNSRNHNLSLSITSPTVNTVLSNTRNLHLNDKHKCNQLTKRSTTPRFATDENKVNYQRKYDNNVFGYNEPNQIILPPLPI